MVASETRNTRRRRRPYVARAGTLNADLQTMALFRAYLVAAHEADEAEQRRKAAREAYDQAVGTHQTVTFAGKPVCSFEDTETRRTNLDGLAADHPDVYAAYVTTDPGYRISVDAETKALLLYDRQWRSKLRRRAA
jgi:hypothetical protein